MFPTTDSYESYGNVQTYLADIFTTPTTAAMTFREKPYTFVLGGTSLYGMMTAVLAKGWSSYVSGTNEAYVLLDLGQRMNVKVVTTLGHYGGSYYENSLRSHFIGLYDQTALPLNTAPKAYIAGKGGSLSYARGWDNPINAWGRYVAVWNSFSNNYTSYIVLAYVAVFAT